MCPFGNAVEHRTYIVGECEIFKEEGGGVGGDKNIDERDIIQ